MAGAWQLVGGGARPGGLSLCPAGRARVRGGPPSLSEDPTQLPAWGEGFTQPQGRQREEPIPTPGWFCKRYFIDNLTASRPSPQARVAGDFIF